MPRPEDTYHVGNHIGQFLHLTNSDSINSQSRANYEEFAQTHICAISLLGCPDATRSDFRGACPQVQYTSASRTPEDVAIEDLREMLGELLKILDPTTMLYDRTNIFYELD